MNDYWNDPPEYPEVPECCGDEMNVTENGTCICEQCGKRIEPQIDVEPIDIEHFINVPEVDFGNISKCPHGKNWGDCASCDYASDIAFDAARER